LKKNREKAETKRGPGPGFTQKDKREKTVHLPQKRGGMEKNRALGKTEAKSTGGSAKPRRTASLEKKIDYNRGKKKQRGGGGGAAL